jgi:pseudouridine-5'-monophosphatase
MSQSPPKIRACLFDMDGTFFSWFLIAGLLIDSERVYTQVTNSILASYGKGPLPAEIKAQLMGMVLIKPTNLRTSWATCINILCDIDVGNKGVT